MTTEPTGLAPAPIAYIPDHPARAVRRLLSQDRDADKPRMRAFVRALGEGCQALEDQVADLIGGRSVLTATGRPLDQWGAIVGEQRGGLADDDYRRFILARIAANRCQGDAEGILLVWSLVTAPSSQTRMWPLYPGWSLVVVRSEFLSEPVRRRARRMMNDIHTMGCQMELVEALDGYVGLDGDPFMTPTGPLARIL